MRNGCLPNLGNTYFWKRKSKKEGIIAAKAKEATKANIEEYWIREDVEDKSHVHDSSTSINNGSLRMKEVTNVKPRDKVVYKPIGNVSSNANKNSGLREKEGIAAEAKEMADEEDSTQDQANPRQEDKGGDGFTTISGRKPPHFEFNKAKTFDLRGVKGREEIDHGFNKVKTFDLRGVKGVEQIVNGFSKVKTFDLKGVKSNGK